MSIIAGDIIDRARAQLIDTAAVQRWTDEEMLGYLSDAQRTVVAIAPAASGFSCVVALASGTRQPLASTVHTLLSISNNCNAAGTVAGRAVRVALREQLDAVDPDWHTATAAAAVQNYTFDPSEDAFYVYPPNTGTGYVRALCSRSPAQLASLADTMVVQDIYAVPLFDYVMFRAHAKDGDFAAGQALAQSYLSAFTAFMGVSEDALLKSNPNLQLAPTNLSVEGGAK